MELVKIVIEGQAVLFKRREQLVLFTEPQKDIIATIDPELISMVLDNLLDNAGKYSLRGGRVTIDVKQTPLFTSVSIRDKGVGILKSDNNKLFKRFGRIHNSLSISAGGTGLGLYWAKKILDLHSGTIEVVSVVNVGSTFTIKIPTHG